jgi:hypothetical protein
MIKRSKPSERRGTMVVIGVDGKTSERAIEAGQVLDLVREALDDYLELVPRFVRYRGHPCVAFCGEHGKINRLELNPLATDLWRVQVAIQLFTDFLVGPVVIIYGPPGFMRAL